MVCGIDYSITSPAICVHPLNETFCFESCSFYYLSSVKRLQGKFLQNIWGETYPEKYKNQTERFMSICDWAMNCIGNISYIAIEGYAMGAKGLIFNIAENTQTLKLKLYEKDILPEIYAPSEIKKFATTKRKCKQRKNV